MMPVAGQRNIINVVPGDTGYSDFWQVNKVMVPANYTANSISSYQAIIDSGYLPEPTDMLVNCPVVSEGSIEGVRYNGGDPGLTEGWYKNMMVYFFTFAEKSITADQSGNVPLAPVYVTFNINPGLPGGGPPSGFKMEDTTGLTHNVVSVVPADTGYSPLWDVNIYDNADFNSVHNLASALSAKILAQDAAHVNCPVVSAGTVTAAADGNNPLLPASYSLEQNYPNPFNPSTVIKFSVIRQAFVSLSIYNSIGQKVAQPVNGILSAGNHSITRNAGVYIMNILKFI